MHFLAVTLTRSIKLDDILHKSLYGVHTIRHTVYMTTYRTMPALKEKYRWTYHLYSRMAEIDAVSYRETTYDMTNSV